MENFTIKLQTDGKKPLYDQLYRHIVGEIEAGRLKAGEKLPSKRAVCAHLHISQSTVETAYGMLAAEGYIRARPKSGYYVSAALYRPMSQQAPPQKPAAPAPGEAVRYDFSTGAVDTVTSVSSVAVIVSRAWATKSPTSSIHSPSAGPGAGHHAVSSCLSTAAVTERAGSAPPKLLACAAEDEARTCPPCSTTRANGPVAG